MGVSIMYDSEMINEAYRKLGKVIRAAREERGLKRTALSKTLDIPYRALLDFEVHGTRLTISYLYKLAKYLNVSLDTYLEIIPLFPFKSDTRIELESILDSLSDKELKILSATAQAMRDTYVKKK